MGLGEAAQPGIKQVLNRRPILILANSDRGAPVPPRQVRFRRQVGQ